MAADTIRSFLVSLGFKVDAATMKKFGDTITAATTKAQLLADGIEKMAKAIISNIHAVATDLSNLYYASVRIGTSASNLKALTQAAQDFGVSAEEALGNMESLSKILNTDPGAEAFMNSLGVKTRQANGEMRDMQDIVNDLGPVLAKLPGYLSQSFAETFGLTYKFRRFITDPGFLQDLEKHQKLLGNGYDDAAKKAAELEQQFRELGDRWDRLKKQFEVNIFGPVIDWLEQGEKYLQDHEPEMEAYITSFGQTIEKTYNVIASVLSAFDWSNLLGLPYFEKAFNWIEKIGKLFLKTADQDLGFSAAWQNILGETKFGEAVRRGLAKPTTFQYKFAASAADLAAALHNPGNLKYRGQPGAIRAGGSPSQREFASFRTDDEGMLALARQLNLDFRRGRTTISSLLEKYAPASDNNLPAYIADVSRQMHRAAGANLNLNDPAVLAAMMNAVIQHEHNANPYSPALVRREAEIAVRGGGGTVNQTNHITIDGSKDPAATKQIVLDTFSELNQKAVRGLQPTTQ